MGGQAGGRGYLIQALISVLDALTEDHDWTAIQLEPNLATDKVDILWEYPTRRKVAQVKSTQNQLNLPEVKEWAEELERSIVADEYELSLIGPTSQGVIDLGQHGKVRVPSPRPLDLDGLVAQAAHKLDHYLQSSQIGIRSPTTREMVVNALVTRLSRFATTGTLVRRDVFDKLLFSWVGTVAETDILPEAPLPPPSTHYELQPEDLDVLQRLAGARQNLLHFMKCDSVAGFVVGIDGEYLADPLEEPDLCIKHVESITRLRHYGLIINPRRDGQTFNLSSSGRDLVQRYERICQRCGKSKENIETRQGQPPQWVCRHPRCLDSTFHRGVKCAHCGKRPGEIVSQGVGYTEFLCEDGHRFTERPRRN